jgi:putative salt-induced outer membrane protein
MLNLKPVWRGLFFGVVSVVAISASATPKKICVKKVPVKSVWDGSNATVGFTMNTGNTQSKNFNGSVNLQYKKNRWTNTAYVSMQLQKSEGVLSKDKYTANDQVNYSYNKAQNSFIFGNLDATMDHFSAYKYVLVTSAGYGRDIIKNDDITWSAQIGPGWRRNVVREDDTPTNRFIITTQTNVAWSLTKAGTLTETARFDYGKPYNYFQTVTAFTNKIIGNLAMQVSFELDYYSAIPPMSSNTKKTDTTTALSLVYNF